MEDQLKTLIKILTGFGSQRMEDIGVAGFIFVMIVSLVCSIFIAHLYRYFYLSKSTGSQIHRAFPLLGVSITSIFITIQFSLPLSLGLLGALSIVRFRTPIKEPEEIGFLMLVIATAIGCATFNFLFLGIVLMTAVFALLSLKYGILYQTQEGGFVVIKLPIGQEQSKRTDLVNHLDRTTHRGRLESISKAEDHSVISYAFQGLGRSSVSDLQDGLDELVGSSSYSIYFNQHRVT
jgi:hypothetical protein